MNNKEKVSSDKEVTEFKGSNRLKKSLCSQGAVQTKEENFSIYTCDSPVQDVEKCFVNQSDLDNCYREWNDIDPLCIKLMKEKGKTKTCKLQNIIRKEGVAKKLWAQHFLGQIYLDFTKLSLDDCVFFFLTLEDNMALKSPGIHKLIKGHYDL
jgi:hypothetical protein